MKERMQKRKREEEENITSNSIASTFFSFLQQKD